ncbi:MAG: shikimate kinase [Elusimicrobiota bacterium]
MNIVLTGMMATGKSSVGRNLAEILAMGYMDTDDLIEKDVGLSIPEIFEKLGEDEFRRLEKKAVRCVSLLDNFVISTGGGVVKDSSNMDELEKNGVVVCLTASAEELYRRAKKASNRPLLKVSRPLDKIKELMRKRNKYYSRCDLRVDTTEKKPDEVTDEIIAFIKDSP